LFPPVTGSIPAASTNALCDAATPATQYVVFATAGRE